MELPFIYVPTWVGLLCVAISAVLLKLADNKLREAKRFWEATKALVDGDEKTFRCTKKEQN